MKPNRITNADSGSVSKGIAKPLVTRRFWSDDERKILSEMFADNYTETICKIFNRSYRSVCSQATLMGLKKSEAFMKMELERQADRLRIVGVQSRYHKGREPENKGKPMRKEVYEKVKRTMFKKGNKPHNTTYDGHERISKDGYVEIRIRLCKYVLKHRHIWEQANGKVPKGYIVVFKDRNPNNIVLENLELISREENMYRNSKHGYPLEVIPTLTILNKLKKKIHEKQNG